MSIVAPALVATPPAAAPATRVEPGAVAVATTAQRAIKVLQSSSAPAQRSLFLRPRPAG
jgi:hypothetical protein